MSAGGPGGSCPGCSGCYVAAVTLTFVALTFFAASQTTWQAADLRKFALLLGCGLVSVAATPRMAYLKGG